MSQIAIIGLIVVIVGAVFLLKGKKSAPEKTNDPSNAGNTPVTQLPDGAPNPGTPPTQL
jgi:hypothetical protein